MLAEHTEAGMALWFRLRRSLATNAGKRSGIAASPAETGLSASWVHVPPGSLRRPVDCTRGIGVAGCLPVFGAAAV